MKIVLVVIAVLCGLALILGIPTGNAAPQVVTGAGIIAAALATVAP